MSNQILQDASPDDLRLAIEQNNIDLFYAAAAAGGATILSEAGVSGVMAKPWWPSFLFDPSFSNEDVSGQLELLRLRIVEDGWPAVLKFGPKGKPTDLERDLSRSGFVAMDHRPPGMATCLSTANDDHIKCDDLAVETVTNAVQLSEWLGFYGVFEFKMLERLIELPEVMLYIGRIGEKAVGSSMLFLGAGVAGFYQVQVLPEYRRRGIGTALTVVPMRDARQAGYSYAVLQAFTMGEPVYLRIGFESYFHYAFYHPVGYTYSDFIAVPGPRRN